MTRFQISINLLEFAAALFALVKWGPLLRDSIVSFGTDNTATVSWLTRARAKASSADRLLKTYSMVCLAYGIHIAPYHVPGIHNHLADVLSRHPDFYEDPDESNLSANIASYRSSPEEFIDMVQTHSDQLQSRGLLSRTIVMAAVFRHSHYSYNEILLLINMLARPVPYPQSAFAPRELCSALFTHSTNNEGSGN
jgi:hypothetical protein